jgi:hypothetical protein
VWVARDAFRTGWSGCGGRHDELRKQPVAGFLSGWREPARGRTGLASSGTFDCASRKARLSSLRMTDRFLEKEKLNIWVLIHAEGLEVFLCVKEALAVGEEDEDASADGGFHFYDWYWFGHLSTLALRGLLIPVPVSSHRTGPYPRGWRGGRGRRGNTHRRESPAPEGPGV